MNVLIDHHHTELTYSFELLFGKRLGGRVYYPIGREWFERGYWKVFPHPATVEQYLGMHQSDRSVAAKGEVVTGSGVEPVEPGVHYVKASTKDHYERALTFDEFLKRPIDLVVASMPAHAAPFTDLVARHKPSAKLIFQMGNTFPDFDFRGVKNVMNSTARRLPFRLHSVTYSQEFDLDLFGYAPPSGSMKIVNFVHYMPETAFFEEVARRLPEYAFESYGSGNSHGTITGTHNVARKMKEAALVWHLKKIDDGYGHVVHNAAATGRPLIISKSHYQKLRFGKFIEDGKTCIDADGLSADELAKKIRRFGEPGRLERMGKELYARFRRYVDFNRDEKNVRRFLAGLR